MRRQTKSPLGPTVVQGKGGSRTRSETKPSKTKDDIVLGVLIPTRNREEFLVHAVESCVRFREASPFRVELFVANNGDLGLGQATVGALEGALVTMIERPSEPVSMSQNWQRGFESVQKTAVTHLLIMGDDDFLLSSIRKEFVNAFLDGFDGVICDRAARHYRWETSDSPSRVRFSRRNHRQMATRMRTSPEDMFVSPDLYTQGPGPYQGFISVDWLNRVLNEFGVLSPSRSPDVFLSFALATYGEFSSISLDRSFLVDGQSPKSNGASMLGFSDNKEPGLDFKRLSAFEFSSDNSLPGLEDFPSLFVATTEVYDWVKLKRPELRNLDIQAVMRGMSVEVPGTNSPETQKLKAFAKANGYCLPPLVQREAEKYLPEFEFGRRRFSVDASSLTPVQACEILASYPALAKFLWRKRASFARCLPANLRRLGSRAVVKLRDRRATAHKRLVANRTA